MKTPEEKNEIAAFERQLEPFLRQNPYSRVQKKRKFYFVINPWNDESIALILKRDSYSDLIAALNNLILPPRFTALYHLDSNTMEYIYTLLDKDDPCFSRQFEFTLDSKPYLCKFGEASERLLILSKFFRRTGKESGTDYRNLLLLREYTVEKSKRTSIDDYFVGMKPISFYVSGFENFDETTISEVSKHLNFFMHYYDRECPTILIHSVESELTETAKQLQFIETTFPGKISTGRKDSFLLDLTLAAIEVETRLKFLYYYQILEYAAFYYIDDEIRRDLLNIISTPDIHSNPERHISRILETVANLRQEEEAKISKLIKMACAPDIIWKELQQNTSHFTKTQEFDGGFVLEPFISEDTTLEGFSSMWLTKMPVTLRIIRNALVHGHEKRFGAVIKPTPRNDLLIKPWLAVARRIAEQVIIFGRLV